MTDKQPSIFSSLFKWRETYELSFQLSNIVFTLLESIMDYCKKNNIPIHEERSIWNLAEEARHIFKQIEEVNSPNYRAPNLPRMEHIRRKFTGDESDEDLTEP